MSHDRAAAPELPHRALHGLVAVLCLLCAGALALLAWWQRQAFVPLRAASADSALAEAALQRVFVSSALALAVMCAVAVGGAWFVHRLWSRQLEEAQRLAQSLAQGGPPDGPRARPGAGRSQAQSHQPRGAPGTVAALLATLQHLGEHWARLRRAHRAQTVQVRALQHVVQTDDATGLWRRNAFVVRLERALSDADGPGCGLLLVRLPDLEDLNMRHGRVAVDRWLKALGETLAQYPAQAPGTCVGRLNGRDIALLLPLVGLARETAEAVHEALRASGRALGIGADTPDLRVGGVDGLRGIPVGAALAAADAALAQAELSRTLVVDWHAESAPMPVGAAQWRRDIALALDEGRIRLVATAVRHADGRLSHFDSEPALQLQPGAAPLPVQRWLAMASRGALLMRAESLALLRVLQACHEDALPRSLHLSVPSVQQAAFQQDVMHQLQQASRVAGLVTLEIDEQAFQGAMRHELLAWLGGLPCRWALCPGTAPLDTDLLHQAVAPSYVKLDPGLTRGVAVEPALQRMLGAQIDMLAGLSVRAVASEVDDSMDLQRLWQLGLHAASGRALGTPPDD